MPQGTYPLLQNLDLDHKTKKEDPMQRKSTWMLISVLAILSFILTACAPAAPAVPPTPVLQTVIVGGTPIVITATPAPTEPPAAQPAAGSDKKILSIAVGANDLPSIDPSHAQTIDEVQIIGSNSIAVVRQNEVTAEVEPGMATDTKISEDGLTYTFTLRTDIPWVKYDAKTGQVVKVQDCNGKDRMVTAADFVYGTLRTLNPKTSSEYAYVLTPYMVGAADYNNSQEADPAKLEELAAKVGVKAIDEKTIEYKFITPGVFNLNIIGLWVNHAQPKWLIEGDDCSDARGDRWTETGFYQGYGPFTLKEWVHDSNITLIKNPFWPGTKEIPVAKIDEVLEKFIDVTAALADYEAGNLDEAGIPSGDYDRIVNDPQFKPQIRQVITLGTEFYAFNTALAPTDDSRVRLALSLAIDRQSLLDNVVKSGVVAPFFTNPGAAGAPKPENYPNLGVKFDPAKAKELLDSYLKEKNITADKLNIVLMSNAVESRKQAGEAIVGMWKQNLGIDVKFTTQETKVFMVSRQVGQENIYRSSWVQDYPDTNNFLFEPFGFGGGFSDVVDWPVASSPEKKGTYTTGGNKPYDQFMEYLKQAAVEKDPTKRSDLYAKAEEIFVQQEAIVAPLYWYSTPVLIRSEVKDTNSITGYDHWEKWDITR
jgi:oligopeptide transport system substrate-binding protein